MQARLWRGLSIGLAALLLMLAARVYLGRFERLFQEGTIFSGVTYTDAHVTLSGTLVVCVALIAARPWRRLPRSCCTAAALACWRTVVPAIVCYI